MTTESTRTSTLHQLLNTLPQQGMVRWMGVRPARDEPMTALQEVQIAAPHGLAGDRFAGRANSARQVTLIQQEHLQVIAACLGGDSPLVGEPRPIDPALLRRNIVVAGINLLALKDKHFHIGEVQLEYTGLCHPCSKMERRLGPGGYNAMRGHGGITARVLTPGLLRLGDSVRYADSR